MKMNYRRLLVLSLWLLLLSSLRETAQLRAASAATAADRLTVLPGFKVELLRSAAAGEGSWICMTLDPKGRLLISPQEGVSNLLRITLSAEGQVAQIEKIPQPV